MATHVVPSAIVFEVLREDNYDNWSACMKSYMLAQDLWDIIEATAKPLIQEAWMKRNAMALHAIQISCDPHLLSQIRDITSAKKAWNTLENMLKKDKPEVDTGAMNNELDFHLLELIRCIKEENWEAVKGIHERHPDAIKARIAIYGGTALHIAADIRSAGISMELTKLMSEEDLEIQDNNGYTALHVAAYYGLTEVIECMIRKNQKLVTMGNGDGELPLAVACRTNKRDVAVYLYSRTPHELLFKENGKYGSLVLDGCVMGRMFDMALDLLHHSPSSDAALHPIMNSNLMEYLSNIPEAFPSGNRMAFWQRCIYNWIKIQPYVPSNGVSIYVPDEREKRSKNIIVRVFGQLRKFATNHLDFLGIKRIYDLKLGQFRLLELVACVCGYLSNLDRSAYQKTGVIQAYKNVVKFGIPEFYIMILRATVNLVDMSRDEDERVPVMSAVAHRQKKIFGSMLTAYRKTNRETHESSFKDKFGNTVLHLAGMLSPPSQLSDISGAALRMQRELQWYKQVENFVDPRFHKHLNHKGETAKELFTKEHKDLMAEGEKWMKETAQSCSLVGALIITIMFTAAFTVPGGYDQSTNLPVFLNNKSFKIFIISDTISLFSSSTSVLIFLGILTSRFAEQDFLESLPKKLIIGLATLFLSIATMMLAFSATLVMILDGQTKLIVAIVSLAAIPVVLFLFLQVPLLFDVLKSTYGPSIFAFREKDYHNVIKLVNKQIHKQKEARL